MMNPKYMLLAARLLNEAADNFSHNGCNDFDMTPTFTKAEALAFVREAYLDNDPKDGLKEFDEVVDRTSGDVRGDMPDWWVMRFLAKKLKTEAEATIARVGETHWRNVAAASANKESGK